MKTKSFFILSISLIVVVSLLVSSIINISVNSEIQKEKISKNLMDHSNHITREISLIMNERLSDLQLLADPQNSIIGSSEVSLEDKIAYLRMFERATKTYTSISVYDLTGTKIIDTRNFELGVDASDQSFFNMALNGEFYYDAIPVFKESLNTTVLHFSASLYDENGDISGVLVTTFPMYKFHEIIDDGTLPDGTEIDLVSKNGLVLYSNHDRMSILNEKFSIKSMFEENASLNNHVGYGIFDKNNDEYFYVLSPEVEYLSYFGNNWYVLLTLPTTIAFQEVGQSQYTLYIITGMIFALSILMSIFLSNRFSKPILELTKATRKIQNNDLNLISKIKGTSEIQELFTAYNSMVTSIKKQRQELLELDKAKDEFTSMITHEIKNPLVPIVGYSDMLLHGNSIGNLNEKQKNAVQIILKNSLALEQLTSDFLDVQKLELGKMNFDIKEFDCGQIINDIYLEHNLILEKSNIQFKKSIESNEKILVDKNRISQIFNNLILNSISFLPDENKIIEIGTFEKNSEIIFYIKDNGIGIEKTKQKNLFKKFYQTDTTNTRKHSGTGLGLSICKGIIDAHGGEIWCESTLGLGTTMLFSIPFKKQILMINE